MTVQMQTAVDMEQAHAGDGQYSRQPAAQTYDIELMSERRSDEQSQ